MKITTETLPVVRRQWVKRATAILVDLQNESMEPPHRLRCFGFLYLIKQHVDFLNDKHRKKYPPGGIVATYTSNSPQVDTGEYIIPKFDKK